MNSYIPEDPLWKEHSTQKSCFFKAHIQKNVSLSFFITLCLLSSCSLHQLPFISTHVMCRLQVGYGYIRTDQRSNIISFWNPEWNGTFCSYSRSVRPRWIKKLYWLPSNVAKKIIDKRELPRSWSQNPWKQWTGEKNIDPDKGLLPNSG